MEGGDLIQERTGGGVVLTQARRCRIMSAAEGGSTKRTSALMRAGDPTRTWRGRSLRGAAGSAYDFRIRVVYGGNRSQPMRDPLRVEVPADLPDLEDQPAH